MIASAIDPSDGMYQHSSERLVSVRRMLLDIFRCQPSEHKPGERRIAYTPECAIGHNPAVCTQSYLVSAPRSDGSYVEEHHRIRVHPWLLTYSEKVLPSDLGGEATAQS